MCSPVEPGICATENGTVPPPIFLHCTWAVTVSVALIVNINVLSPVSSDIETESGRLLITGS